MQAKTFTRWVPTSTFCSLFVALVACRGHGVVEESESELTTPAHSLPEAPLTCAKYPVPYRPDGAAAEALARAELASLAPSATMTFSTVRGTLASVYDVDAAVADCRNDQPVDGAIDAFVAAHHDLFQADPDEWERSPLTCESIGTEGTLVAWHRRLLGAREVRTDVLWFRLVRKDDVVIVTAVGGTYLPEAPRDLRAQLLGCERFDPEAATAGTLSASYPFRTYDYCAPTGDYLYDAAKPDRITFAAEPTWSWQEIENTIVLSATVSGALDVAPEHVTPELTRSDANCDGERIGFRLAIDANSSKLVSSLPGIDCTVCAQNF